MPTNFFIFYFVAAFTVSFQQQFRLLVNSLPLNGSKQDGVAAGGKWTPPNLAIVKRISVPWHCNPAKCATSILVLFHVQLLEAEVVMKGDSFLSSQIGTCCSLEWFCIFFKYPYWNCQLIKCELLYM